MSISKDSKNIQLDTKRHSFAHIMAAAVGQMFPEAQFGVGPVIETGCYYDFVLPRTLIPEDLLLIEEKIKALLARNLVMKRQEISIEDAILLFEKMGQPLKVELLNDLRTKGTTSLKDEEGDVFQSQDTNEFSESSNMVTVGAKSLNSELPIITIYRLEDEDTGEDLFVDLCKGPHISSVSDLKNAGFKLDKFSAAYWRGDQKRGINMQRLYALVFDTQDELDKYIFDREEAKKRDHRVLGEKLDLFSFSDLVGAGLPLYTPKGTVLKKTIYRLLEGISKKYGSLEVSIPHIAKRELYETSGHAQKFANELFTVVSHYNVEFVMKPVNCPHHTQIYASKPRSYRDLPLRYIESTLQYRDEKPGQIGGLTRTRGFQVDDGHTFLRVDQIKTEITLLVKTIEEFYQSFGLWDKKWVSFSVRDYAHPENYTGLPEDWDVAENMLEEISRENNLNAKRCEGEAAIYGPKLDFMFIDALGNERQLATVQLDFATPKRFKLEYIDSDGSAKPPVMIHRAILGSYERFLAILIEHFAGRFPFWLAPQQVRILTVNDSVGEYIDKIRAILDDTVLMKPVKYNELRYEIDNRSESLGKKIREAETDKIPVILIVGPKDVEAELVSVRTQEGESKVAIGKLKGLLEGM